MTIILGFVYSINPFLPSIDIPTPGAPARPNVRTTTSIHNINPFTPSIFILTPGAPVQPSVRTNGGSKPLAGPTVSSWTTDPRVRQASSLTHAHSAAPEAYVTSTPYQIFRICTNRRQSAFHNYMYHKLQIKEKDLKKLFGTCC